MADAFERYGSSKDFDRILDKLAETVRKERKSSTPASAETPCRHRGRIYLRTHVQANQGVIRLLEKHGQRWSMPP